MCDRCDGKEKVNDHSVMRGHSGGWSWVARGDASQMLVAGPQHGAFSDRLLYSDRCR